MTGPWLDAYKLDPGGRRVWGLKYDQGHASVDIDAEVTSVTVNGQRWVREPEGVIIEIGTTLEIASLGLDGTYRVVGVSHDTHVPILVLQPKGR